MSAIARKDWREFVRDRRLLLASVLVAVIALVALALAWVQVREYEQARVAAEDGDRRSWLAQGERNPHGAAHFANWAFRPLTPLAMLDPGVGPYAPAAIWMEAHSQNPGVARAVEDRTTTLDLGEFSLGWVLQVLAPLLVLVLSAGLVARERERGTLQLMLVAGASPARLVWAKATSLARIVAVVLAPLAVVSVAIVLMAPAVMTPDQGLRLGLWLTAHVAYLAVFIGLGVAASVFTGGTERALLLVVALWLVAVPLGPRLGGALADAVHPHRDAQAFWAQIDADFRDGLPGDPDRATREAAFEAATLARFGVATTDALPVSWSGLTLDASERYGYRVFDRRFAELHAARDRERATMRLAAAVSPLVALQRVSAALAGTDEPHHREFARQAEAHRRILVNQLNDDLVQHGAGKTYAGYNADETLWKATPVFRHRAPSVMQLARTWHVDAALLAFWALLALLARAWAGRRLAAEVSR